MKHTRNTYQAGSIRKVQRKSGIAIWEYRYRDHSVAGSPMRQITLSTLEFPTKAKALVHLQEQVLKINGPDAFRAHNKVTMGVLIDRFQTEERLEEIVRQAPGEVTITDGLSYSTAAGYRSYLNKHVKPRWSKTAIVDMKALEVLDCLKSLPLAPKTQAQMRALLHLLFERAVLWGLIELQRNPIELVRLKGTSRRTRKPQVLLPEKFQELTAILPELYRTMSVVAMCTGLRVSEVLALCWEHIDFHAGVLLAQKGVVNGRVGRVKPDLNTILFRSILLLLSCCWTRGAAAGAV